MLGLVNTIPDIWISQMGNSSHFKAKGIMTTQKYAIVNTEGKLFNPKGETWDGIEPIALKTKSYLTWLRKKHIGHITMNCVIKKIV